MHRRAVTAVAVVDVAWQPTDSPLQTRCNKCHRQGMMMTIEHCIAVDNAASHRMVRYSPTSRIPSIGSPPAKRQAANSTTITIMAATRFLYAG